MDYLALKDELTNGHPVTGAYDADDALAAGEINALNITSIKASLSGSEMWANTDPTEFNTLTDGKKLEWLSFCAIENHNPENNGLAHKFVEYVFGASSDTETALASTRTETTSRAQEIAGTIRYSKILESHHITTARALP